jgi:hypothetical protein
MKVVAERICDGEILRLIQMWLKALPIAADAWRSYAGMCEE